MLASSYAFLPAMAGAWPAEQELSLHVFSKHLQFLNYQDMADAAAEIGFDGIDLTVRKGGHVTPEKVAEELPAAVAAIRKAGLLADMMATDVNDANDPLHRQVLETASAQSIKWYRLGYYSFKDDQPIPDRLKDLNRQMKQLAKLNRRLGLAGSYQNHAGIRVGAAVWDVWHLLEDLDPAVMGSQYDIRHAMVEGGTSWMVGLKLIQPKINSLVLKDFIWEKQGGKWQLLNVPLGEGMVDFDAYFKLLKAYRINVPVCVHYEYPLGGAEHGAKNLSSADQATVFKAMKRDLQFARTTWKNA